MTTSTRIGSSNTNLYKTLIDLTRSALEPYMEMVCRWIYSGQIKDPYREFMIAIPQNADPKPKLVPRNCPAFLKDDAEAICSAGINVSIVNRVRQKSHRSLLSTSLQQGLHIHLSFSLFIPPQT